MDTHENVDLTPEQLEANAAGQRQAPKKKAGAPKAVKPKTPAQAKGKPPQSKPAKATKQGQPTVHVVAADTEIRLSKKAKTELAARGGGPVKERKPQKPRTGKTQTMINMLSRPAGATMPDMITASGWNEQSLKWFMKGTLAKKGLTVTKTTEGKPPVEVYRISIPEAV
jgi:hypothetical protein